MYFFPALTICKLYFTGLSCCFKQFGQKTKIGVYLVLLKYNREALNALFTPLYLPLNATALSYVDLGLIHNAPPSSLFLASSFRLLIFNLTKSSCTSCCHLLSLPHFLTPVILGVLIAYKDEKIALGGRNICFFTTV